MKLEERNTCKMSMHGKCANSHEKEKKSQARKEKKSLPGVCDVLGEKELNQRWVRRKKYNKVWKKHKNKLPLLHIRVS